MIQYAAHLKITFSFSNINCWRVLRRHLSTWKSSYKLIYKLEYLITRVCIYGTYDRMWTRIQLLPFLLMSSGLLLIGWWNALKMLFHWIPREDWSVTDDNAIESRSWSACVCWQMSFLLTFFFPLWGRGW